MGVQDDILYLDEPQALRAFCAELRSTQWLALDTEFLRESSYYPQLCLLQLATPEQIALIDPLRLDDLEPLLSLLFDTAILKVVHAGRQDFEIFFHLCQRVPAPVFDTQMAAPLLGYADQIGYGSLVHEVLHVRLPKTHSRTDWSHRPLSRAQIHYAADDVRYLAELYPRMHDELVRRGRLAWLHTDFEALSSPVTYTVVAADAWLRVKGYDRLRGAPLAVLQRLAAWREEAARREDKPRKWLLGDDALLAIAKVMPEAEGDLRRIRGLHPRALKRYARELLVLIGEAKSQRPEPVPEGRRPQPLERWQEPVVDILSAVVKHIAAREDLHPSVLASRMDLERMVRGERNVPALSGWRGELLKAPLLSVLAGKQGLRVAASGLELGPPDSLQEG